MAGFCPVGPWVVTADSLDPRDLRLGCTINGAAIQDGRTSQMRFSIAEVVSYLSRHVRLSAGRPDRDRHAGPTCWAHRTRNGTSRRMTWSTAWIEGIGELTTTIA